MAVLLDLFCGPGGAARGYSAAGFDEIIGVDSAHHNAKPYERVPGATFVHDDALRYLAGLSAGALSKITLIHASPPCQAYVAATLGNNARAHASFRTHHDYIPRLMRTYANMRAIHPHIPPMVVENVPNAPILNDLTLCGLMFHLPLFRHRAFEIIGTDPPPALYHPSHQGHKVKGYSHGKANPTGDIYGIHGTGGDRGSLGEWSEAMQLVHSGMTRAQIVQAIPPAYTYYIGSHVLK